MLTRPVDWFGGDEPSLWHPPTMPARRQTAQTVRRAPREHKGVGYWEKVTLELQQAADRSTVT